MWARLLGDGEAGLRSLSALAGVCVIPAAYAAATELISPRAGLICAALTACNPFLIWYSQEARSYELLVALCAVGLAAFARVRARPNPRGLTLWTVTCALSLATHYFAVLAVVPQATWLLVEHRRRRAVQVAIAIVALCGLALIPLALSQNGTGHDGWVATAPLGERLGQVIPQFLIGTDAPARKPLKFVAMALGLIGFALLAARACRTGRRGASVAALLTAAGFLIGLALIVLGFDDLISRNIIELWLPAAIVVTAGLATARPRRLGAAATVGLCLIGIVATVGVAVNPSMQRPDWRPVARALGPAPAPRAERAILIQHYRDLLPLSLYLPDLAVMRSAAPVEQLDVIAMRSPQQPLCWWGAACNLIPSQMQVAYPVPGFRVAWRKHVRQFTILDLVAHSPVLLTRPAVARALRTTRLEHDVLLLQPR